MSQPEYELQDLSQPKEKPATSGFTAASVAALDESTTTWAWATFSMYLPRPLLLIFGVNHSYIQTCAIIHAIRYIPPISVVSVADQQHAASC